jgi:autotransporter-associated beta strand protein
MKSKPNPFLRYPLALAASSTFLSMSSAQAATYDWTGATDSNFTEAGNWTQNSWTQWHDYRMGGTPTNASITINGYFGIGSLTLQSGLTTDIVINSSNTNPVIMHTGIAGSATIAIASDSKNLTINGEYVAGSAVTWDVGANRTLTMNGPLNNWNGTASLVKNGAGTAVLSGTNGYTGATNVNNGLLQVGTQNGLASNSAITVASGAELSMTAASNNTLGIDTGLTLNGGTLSAGGGAAATNYGNFHLGNSGSISVGNNTGTSNITGNLSVDGRDIHNNIGGFSAITVGDNSTLAISGNVNGVSGVSWGGVSKYGNGTLKLTGTGGYAQGMYLAAGTVEFEENALGLRHASSPNEGYAADFAGNATLRWAAGNTQDLSGNGGNGTYIASQMRIGDGVNATLDTNGNNVTLATAFSLGGSQTGALTKAGAGTLTLTAVNSHSGGTTITAGTVRIGNGGSTGSLGSGAIVNNGELVYNIAGGSVNVNNNISGTGTLSVTGDQSINFADGTSISTTGSQTYSATATGGRYYGFNLADNATVTLTSTAGNISMAGMLGTANSNTGNLVINTSAGNGNVTLNTPAGVPGVDYGLNALTVTAGTGNINLGTHNTQDWYNVTALSLTGGVINSTANMVQFGTLTVNNSSTSAFSGNLTASGGALVKEGVGILTLSGDNSHSGGTTIHEGTLVATRGKLGTGAVVINDGGTLLANDQWVLNSTNPYGVTERNIGSLTINAGGTLQLDNTNGFVNGVANLYLNGGLVTGGPNDFRGDLFLYNGNQQITAGGVTTSTIASVIGVTGNNSITVDGGSMLNITGGIKDSDWNNNGTTPGGIIKSGTGTLTLTGPLDYNGTTTVNGGTLALPDGDWKTGGRYSSGTGASGTIIVGAGATLSTSSGVTGMQNGLTLNGGTVSSRGLTHSNYRNLLLESNITAGGAATSTISSEISLAGDREIAVSTDSTLNITGGIANDGFFGGSQGITKTGTGTLKLTAANNSYTGATVVSDGTLVVNGNISTSSMTTAQSGAAVSGSGTVGSLTINSGAFLNPGNSPGILNVDGDFTQAGTLTMEINGIIAGTQHDQLNVNRVSGNGSVSLSGALVTAFSGNSYTNGNLLFILLNDESDAITGTFSGLAQDSIVTNYGGLDWKISYTADSTSNTFTGGNDVALMAIPEPHTTLLGSLALLCILRRKR